MKDQIVIHWNDQTRRWGTDILTGGALLEVGQFETQREARLFALRALEQPWKFPPTMRHSVHPNVVKEGDDHYTVKVSIDGHRFRLGPVATEAEAIEAAYDLDKLVLSDPNSLEQLKRLTGDKRGVFRSLPVTIESGL